MRFIRTAVALFACAGLTLAQAGNSTARIDVSVTDSTGKPVADLTKDSFLLLEDGAAQSIQNVTPTDTPWNFVLLFDNLTWGSMLQGVEHFVGDMNPRDRVTIAAFRDRVDLLLDWRNVNNGNTREVRLNPVTQRPEGLKDVYGALRWAISKLEGAKGRKAVLVFTDGRDGRLAPQWLVNDRKEVIDPLFGLIDAAEGDDFVELFNEVRRSGARFYFVTANTSTLPSFQGRTVSGIYPNGKEVLAEYLSRIRVRLERLAEASNGRLLVSNSTEEAIAQYARLYQTLQFGATYTLEYSSSHKEEDLPLPIEITLRDRNLRARYLPSRR